MIRMSSSLDVIRQAAAIPLLDGLICVITSRSGKRWVVPKGCLEPGKTAGEIALQEAWEEAGLTGVLEPEAVGSYVYTKMGFMYHVTVFLMQVTEAAEEWPERELRERAWLTRSQALLQIEEPGLRDLVREAVAARISTRDSTTK
jgi:8-oxo-dGTP pyrophosphatase MutT (NUDIX family)